MSRTILGLILAAAALAKAALGWEWLEDVELETALEHVAQITGIVIAWYGRKNAKTGITWVGVRKAGALLLMVCMVGTLAACATTTQPADLGQQAKVGEGNKDTSAAGFGAVATTRRGAKLHDGTASGGNAGGEILEPVVLWNPETKTWTPIFDAEGRPLMKVVRGLRDYHNYIGSTLSVTATGSGTTDSQGLGQTGTTGQTSTPTTTVSPETDVSGIPGN